MSVQDIIKKSVLRSENFTTQNAGKIVATLLFAIALERLSTLSIKSFLQESFTQEVLR